MWYSPLSWIVITLGCLTVFFYEGFDSFKESVNDVFKENRGFNHSLVLDRTRKFEYWMYFF